jgi:hypothetical protein
MVGREESLNGRKGKERRALKVRGRCLRWREGSKRGRCDAWTGS